jgi:hypothetical protein
LQGSQFGAFTELKRENLELKEKLQKALQELFALGGGDAKELFAAGGGNSNVPLSGRRK